MGEEEKEPEIHNINVVRLDNDRFKIVFGTKTEINNLFSAATEIEIDRTLLEEFIKTVRKSLKCDKNNFFFFKFF